MRNFTLNPILLGILLAYLFLVSAYIFAVPLWEAPDEPAHFIYVHYFAENGVPQPRPAWLPGGWLVNVITGYEWYQTPPYYAIGGLILRANRTLGILPPFTDFPPIIATPSRVFAPTTPLVTEPHLLRFFSALLGLATVLLTYFLAKQILPDQQWLPEMAAGFVAFIPQFTFLHTYITNDSLAILCATLGIFSLTKVAMIAGKAGRREWVKAGLASAPAIATKMTSWVLLPLAALVALQSLIQRRRSFRETTADLILYLSLSTAGLLLSWLLWPDLFERLLGSPHSTGIRPQFATPSHLFGLIPLTHSSFWGHFGWMNLPISSPLLTILDGIALLGLCATGYALIRRRNPLTPNQRNAMRLLLSAIAFVFLSFLLFNLATVQPQGRYFYPAIAPIGFFVAYGWSILAGKYRKRVVMSILALMLIVNVLSLTTIIFPAYGRFGG